MPRAKLRGAVAGVVLSVVTLGACADDDSRRVIADTCVRDGGEAKTCACIGRESVKQLDQDGLDAVVFGALGADADADGVLNGMDEAAKVRFRAGVSEVLRLCEAEVYLRPPA